MRAGEGVGWGGGTGYCFSLNKYILRHRDLEARNSRSYDKKEKNKNLHRCKLLVHISMKKTGDKN